MRLFWVIAGLLGLALLPSCQNTYGGLRVKVTLAGETRTKCVSVSVPNFPPAIVPRLGQDVLEIGISEGLSLTGTVEVTVQRYASADCASQPVGRPEKKPGVLARNTINEIVFAYSDSPGDGGVDGGVDGGADAGCDLAKCAAQAPSCQVSTTCSASGACVYVQSPARAACGDAGACDSSGTCNPFCQGAAPLTPCDDGLACTTLDTCSGGACSGQCPVKDECHQAKLPATCEAAGGCTYTTFNDGTQCNGSKGACLAGACVPTLAISPSNLGTPVITAFTYPDAGWDITPGCSTVIDTALRGPVDGGWCSSTAPTVKVADLPTADAGQVLILAMTGLSVGPDASVSFVGSLPVILVVLGDAGIEGTLSAASGAGATGAGANSAWCGAGNVGGPGVGKGGGGGGALGSSGGAGASTDGGLGGHASALSPAPLRGGCRGGAAAGANGGAGGGAIQLSVGGALSVTASGLITAAGAGGPAGSTSSGGGGAGSGGMILLEAFRLSVKGALITAGGGGGGAGAGAGAGADGTTTIVVAPGGTGTSTGGNGSDSNGAGQSAAATPDFGGGGGGSFGYIYLSSTGAGCDVATAGAILGFRQNAGTCP